MVGEREISLPEFLAGLDLDLSFVHDELKEQGFGTSGQLFSIAHWPEDKLHKMFSEALPLTTAQRFVLVTGLKERAEQ
jgi:hypothetical protein